MRIAFSVLRKKITPFSRRFGTSGRSWLLAFSLVGLFMALWPNACSLYELTGKEDVAGQLRGIPHWLHTAVRPQPRLAVTAVSNNHVIPFGVNTFLEQEVEPEKRARSLQRIHDAGFRFIRQEFPWEDIEIHAKGDFEDRRHEPHRSAWEKYDNIVALANEQGVELIVRLSNPPAWSRADPEASSKAPPDNYHDYGDYVAVVAERYRGQVHYFQLWNEPNGNEEWTVPVSPEEYTDLLCIGYRRVKEANPDAVVLAAALTPTVEVSPFNLSDQIFLHRMYAADAGECFDVMSAQGYGLWSGPTDQRLRPTVINYGYHLLLRDIMVRNGDGHKPIWISEMAWNAVPEELPATYGRVTEEQQAQYGVEAYRRAQAEWPWVGVINYWFFKRPADWERDQSWYYFRLMEPNFTPLPAYQALSAYMNSGAEESPLPAWVYSWMRIRPLLFTLSSAILFFSLLRFLAPQE